MRISRRFAVPVYNFQVLIRDALLWIALRIKEIGMADTIRKARPLTTAAINRITGPAKIGDGRGLQLRVTALGAKSWVLRFMKGGRAHELGLGRYPDVSLDDARAKAATIRSAVAAGQAPVTARGALPSTVGTFDERADAFIESQRAGWSNAKHAAQWQNTLTTYASPVIGRMPVDQITTGDVLRVLQPIWASKPETASRLRGRIEAVLDSAKALGMRTGENPARWGDGGLKQLLPAKGKVRKAGHHAALPYREIYSFWDLLLKQPGIAAKALQFLILTAARTGEVIGARWTEIDFKGKLWTIPATRMKAGRAHRVPLSITAIEILKELRSESGTAGWIFPGPKGALSNMAMLSLLQQADRMNRPDLTVHGFRSTFSDWATEVALTSPVVVEACLAHAVANKTEAAYRRGDLLDRRRDLLAQFETMLALG